MANNEVQQPGALRLWWMRRRAQRERQKIARVWNRMGPGEQLGTFCAILDATPELRKKFREALRVRGYEAPASKGQSKP